MVSSLLMISFIIHVVMLAAVLYLYKEVQVLKKNHHQEMMEIFETYLEEIKAENEILQEQLNPSPKQVHSSTKKKGKSIYNDFLPISETLNDQQLNHEQDLVEHKVDMKTSFEANVLQLHQKGFSVDDIAKQLNSGKTEVALIINLYGKKQHKS